MAIGIAARRLGHSLEKGGEAVGAYLTYDVFFAIVMMLLAVIALCKSRKK